MVGYGGVGRSDASRGEGGWGGGRGASRPFRDSLNESDSVRLPLIVRPGAQDQDIRICCSASLRA